jgi:hypothetical protein
MPVTKNSRKLSGKEMEKRALKIFKLVDGLTLSQARSILIRVDYMVDDSAMVDSQQTAKINAPSGSV